jgi:hypothetical protein
VEAEMEGGLYILACLGAFAKLGKASTLFTAYVCPHVSAATGRMLMKFEVRVFFRKSEEKIQVLLKSENNNGYFT